MPILVRLDEKLHERRMTLTELAARVDITVANLSILKTGKAKAIRFSTLEAICAALGVHSSSPSRAAGSRDGAEFGSDMDDYPR